MSSPSKETEEPSSGNEEVASAAGGSGDSNTEQRPPAKRQVSTAVIEISDTDSDDSDVCAVNSYQASADEVKRIRRGQSSVYSYYYSEVSNLRGNVDHFELAKT